MIRAIFAVCVIALVSVLFTGCATADPGECVLPEPPSELLIVPKPLPPLPVDLPGKP